MTVLMVTDATDSPAPSGPVNVPAANSVTKVWLPAASVVSTNVRFHSPGASNADGALGNIGAAGAETVSDWHAPMTKTAQRAVRRALVLSIGPRGSDVERIVV
jgi:hypothetical protein